MAQDMDVSLRCGEEREKELDAWMSERFGFVCEPVSRADQRRGIDRRVTDPSRPGTVWMVEYKADAKAAETGNVFLETIGYDINGGKLGWGLACQADWIVYWVPPLGRILFVKPDTIRDYVPLWAKEYRLAVASNTKYNAHGILVPLRIFETIATRRYQYQQRKIV